MPYIRRKDKTVYNGGIQLLGEAFAAVGAGDGDLNYVLTSVALAWIDYHKPPYSYTLYSNVVKALECAKLEFYRRKLA
ncbi:hypothetical protein LCGC14_2652580, partial [marine sediment metagenome]